MNVAKMSLMNIDSVSSSVIFTKSECFNIIKLAERKPISEAEYFAPSGAGKNPDIRSATVIQLTDESISSHIFSSMKKMNRLEFEVSRLEPLQLIKYEVGDHYVWHTDWSPVNNKKRKLSMTVQLTDSQDYDGGNVEILDGPELRTIDRGIGMATVFPSWAVHRVTPVTSGTRWALVAWAVGKPFR